MTRQFDIWASRLALSVQASVAATALLVLGFAPPAHGRLLLIPIDGEPVSDNLVADAMMHRIGDGPLPGSVVVEGVGRGRAAQLFDRGIVMLAAPAALCRAEVQPEAYDG